ncbi:ATP-binding protein [Ekhidna sp.]|uniref:Dph6-related ATP pyrophosphatase n=1 Tax=Ekhidna sp. TaxID=2608089 RepID=UPI003B5B9529
MPDKKKTVFHWSSGKDSALALHYLLKRADVQISHLVTTINQSLRRVTMHGTPISLVKAQLGSIGLPHSFIELPESPSMKVYEKCMEDKLLKLKDQGMTHAAFGDIFLEDLKKYREEEMKKVHLECLFPIWKKDTTQLIHEFIEQGFKAVTVCVNDQLGEDFLGREIDDEFLKDLPPSIDPCGENGEFHTFCYDGPVFKQPIDFKLGEKVKRSYPNPSRDGEVYFWFIDLLNVNNGQSVSP